MLEGEPFLCSDRPHHSHSFAHLCRAKHLDNAGDIRNREPVTRADRFRGAGVAVSEPRTSNTSSAISVDRECEVMRLF